MSLVNESLKKLKEETPLFKSKLSRIVYSGFGLVLVIFLGLFLAGFIYSLQLDKELERLNTEHSRKAELTETMFDTARARSVFLFRMVGMDDPFELDGYYMSFQSLAGKHLAARIELEKLELSPREQAALEFVRNKTMTSTGPLNRIAELLGSGKREQAVKHLTPEIIQNHDDALMSLLALKELHYQLNKEALRTARQEYIRFIKFSAFFAFALFMFGLVVTYVVGFRIRSSEQELDENRQSLERQVKARTSLLEVANQQLKEEIEERIAAHDKMRQMAHYDDLTGLPNRKLFQDRLHQALAYSKRSGQQVGLYFIDLDNFKEINDSLGHTVGDILLRHVSKRLLSCIREGDTVARMGGDEFIIIAGGIAAENDATELADRIITTLAVPLEIDNHKVSASGSIGVALHPQHGSDAEALIEYADTAMYKAKEEGRNGYIIYHPQLTAEMDQSLKLSHDVENAFIDDQFRILYQPVVDVFNGRINGIEALLYWEHPQLGLLSPGRFLPLLERNGLIDEVTDWLINKSCTDILPLLTLSHDFKLSVNLSTRQASDPLLAEKLAGMLSSLGFPVTNFMVEINESMLTHGEKSKELLSALMMTGIGIALDDFGAGHASLKNLKQFSIDTVKIERSFIQDLAPGSEDVVILQSMIRMSRDMRLEVIAKGVENGDQFQFLRDNRCDAYQGYFYSPAVSLPELIKFIDLAA